MNRLSQKRTVAPQSPMRAAIAGALRPSSTACCTIWARRTSPAPSVRERAICASPCASSSLNARTRMGMAASQEEPVPPSTVPSREVLEMAVGVSGVMTVSGQAARSIALATSG